MPDAAGLSSYELPPCGACELGPGPAIGVTDSGSAVNAPLPAAGAAASKLYGGGASPKSAVMLRVGSRSGGANDGPLVWAALPLPLPLPLALAYAPEGPDGPDELLDSCSCSS